MHASSRPALVSIRPTVLAILLLAACARPATHGAGTAAGTGPGLPTSAEGRTARGDGAQAWLGTIPGMAEGDGLLLAGVTPGSPADVAGLRAGDRITSLGGRPVTDLQSYADALYARAPGETITVVAMRGAGERLTLRARLGRRGDAPVPAAPPAGRRA